MPAKNSTKSESVQAMQNSPSAIFNMHRNHRGALGLYKLAVILRENEEEIEESRALSSEGTYRVMLAIEHIAYSLYSEFEAQVGALDAQGGSQ